MSLPLKIKITRINLTKTMNFAANMSVTEACKHIREKIGEEGGQDHGLFQPAVPGKHGARWLKPDRTLQYYDLQPNDELEYKKKHRPIKVKLQDETIKTVLVDDTLSVGEIVSVIGEKMSISNADEFSLKVDGKDEWLNGTLSLQEQGVPEEAMLLLRKKFFVSDAQVSVEDPVSLHLVYVESRDHILAGHHPCSQEEAVMFAALQLQIQLGNYDPNNPKKFNLKDYLSPQFHKKIKNFEPLIIKEYRKLVGMQEANAKYRYVQVCRSLKTYGMTFYNVKQKIKGQKKGKPIALGITRSSVIFMDPETKEVTKEAPLTHLRRWAAAPTTFTLDFGDHEDDYLVLVTNEGEAISSLLSGYIDILLKKRNDVASVNTDDDAQYAQEEPVAPIKAKAMTSTTTSIIGGFDGYGGQQFSMSPANQGYARTPGSYSQQAVPTNLVTSVSYIASIISDFGNKNAAPRNTALTPEQWRKQLISNTEVLMSSIAKLTANSSGGKFDKSLLDGKAAEIASNLAQLIAAAKNAAVKKNGEDDADLLDGARRVAEAIRDLLAASKDLGDKPDDPKAYEKFTFAQKALSAAITYMNSASRGILADTSSQKLLLESAKSVLDATFDLVNAAKDKASMMNDSRARDLVNNAGDRTEASAKQLNTEVAVLAPSVLYSGVRKQIEDTAHNVETSMRQLMAALPDDPSLLAAAKLVTDALMQLLATTSIAEPKDDVPDISASAKEVLDETARLMNAQSQQQINMGMKSVIAATTKLVTSAKQAASLSDDEMRDRLLACAKGVASATQKLVAASGPAASNPNDKNARDALNESCQRLAEATKSLIGNAAEKAAFSNLRSTAKIAAAATTGLISNARSATASCNDPVSNENLKAASKVAQEAIQRLVQALQNVYLHPEDKAAQQALIKEAHDASPQAYKLVAASKSALPKVNDPSIKQGLRQAADEAADALQKLVGAHKSVMLSSGQKDVDEALERFAAEEANLDSTILAAASGNLQPDTMQTTEGATQLLNMATKQVATAAKNMATTAKTNPDELGNSAKSLADAISQANSGATQLAAFSSPGVQKEILEAAKGLTRSGRAALTAARAVAANPTDPNLNNGLTNATKGVADALGALLNATKGVQTGGKDVDEAIQAIQAAFGSIQAKPTNAKEFSMHAEDLENNIKAVQSAVSSLVFAVKNNPRMLGPSAKTLASTVPPLIQASNQASGSVPDPKTQNDINSATKNVASALQRLLNSAKNAATKDDPALKNELANVAKNVSDSLDALTRSLNAATPGQVALDEAIKILAAAIAKLASNARANALETSAAIEDLRKGTTSLGDATKNIITFVKSDFNKLGESSKGAANAVNLIADATRSLAESGGRTSAYLAQSERVREVSRELINACSSKDPSAKQGIVKAAKDITTSTQEVVDSVKTDASRIEDESVKNLMMGCAHSVATATSGMVNAAKAVAQNQPQAREKLTQSQQSLNDALDNLLNQDAGKITTPKAKKLISVATDAANGTKRMVEISKGILRRPADGELQTELTNSARAVGIAIKGLLDAAKSMGEVDLDQYIDKLSQAITDLDSASISATVGLLENTAPPGKTTQSLEEEIVENSRELANSIKDLVNAQKESPTALAKAAAVTASIIPKIADLAKQCAGTTTDQEKQQNILGLVKSIADSSLELMQGCKQNDAKEVATQAKNVSQAIAKLLGNLKSNVISQRDCDEAIKMVTESGKKLDMPNNSKSEKRYGETQKLLTDIAKQLVSGIAKVVSTSKSSPQEVGDSSKKVAVVIDSFVNTTQDALSSIGDDEARKNLTAAAKGVMGAATRMIQTAKIVASDPKNAKVQQKMSLAYKEVTDAISTLVSAIKQAATGDLKCEAAAESVARNVSELDGAALYAATGQLQPERDDLDIEEVQTELLTTCEQVAEEVKRIIAATSKGENELGDACQATAERFDKLTKDTKIVAALLNNLLNQQNILGGAKNVGVSIQAFILSSLKVQQSPQDPNEKQKMVNASQQVSTTLKEFVNLAQNAASAASQGIKELETARKAIVVSLDELDKRPGNNQAGATEVLKSAKGMADAIAVILATCGSNEEATKLIKATEDIQDNASALLSNVKGALRLANPEQAKRLMAATKAAVEAVPNFLESAKNQRKNMTPDTTKATGDANEEVVRLIGEMVEAAKVLPGSEEALKLFQETDELERLAESELLNAANAIEAAAKTLLDAKERQLAMRKNKDSPLPDEEITEAILDAANAITVATRVLVGSATAAQKELVSKGKVSQAQNVYRRDPAWAKGLISAAQQVAGSVGELVVSSNNVVSGRIEEEALVASAKGVAAATARLVFASRAKADPFSPTQQKLSAAAKSVATATQQLVLAAKSANEIVKTEEEKPDWDNQSAMAARKAEMEQQMQILKLQKELENAQKKLGEIRKAEYADSGKEQANVPAKKNAQTPPQKQITKTNSNTNISQQQPQSPTQTQKTLAPAKSVTNLQAQQQAPAKAPVKAVPPTKQQQQAPGNLPPPIKGSGRPLPPPAKQS